MRGVATNLTGLRTGYLTVIRRDGSDKQNNALWLCQCECGKEVSIRAGYLKRKEQKYCSKQCRFYTEPMRVDITGQRFGRLVALHYVRSSPEISLADDNLRKANKMPV